MDKLETVVAGISDTHGGGTTALLPPNFTTSEGQPIEANRFQAYLWECYVDYCTQVKAFKRQGANIYGVHVGDVLENNHHNTVQIVSANPEDHIGIGVEILDRFIPLCDAFAAIRGTPAHAGAVSSLEEQVIREFRSYNIDKPEGKGFTHKILRREVSGVRLNVAHHINGGSTPQARNNSITGAVVKHIYRCGEFNEPHAHYLMRGHKHQHGDTGFAYPTRGIVLPAWQWPTEYVYKFDPESAPSIGAVFVLIYANGRHEYKPVIYPFLKDERQYVAVKWNYDGKGKKRSKSL